MESTKAVTTITRIDITFLNSVGLVFQFVLAAIVATPLLALFGLICATVANIAVEMVK
jgi:xanthosine utilization system XapX-like protein